jgi:hypothetical protein
MLMMVSPPNTGSELDDFLAKGSMSCSSVRDDGTTCTFSSSSDSTTCATAASTNTHIRVNTIRGSGTCRQEKRGGRRG